MKIILRRDEVETIRVLAEYYIENHRGTYNEKMAALMLRHKLKIYGREKR